jgi:spore maturation protein CgeB
MIAEKGYNEVFKNHKYTDRIIEMLKIIGE